MKKTILIFAIALIIPASSFSQVYKSEYGYIRFYSETPLENIEGISEKATGALRISDNVLVVSIPIKSFAFEKALMQEHFNETYLESDKYKRGTFKGKVNEKINWKKDGVYGATAKGTMHIHGIDQEITIKGKVVIKEGKINFETIFNIHLEEYEIEIPKIVFLNIAEVIEVTMKMTFAPPLK